MLLGSGGLWPFGDSALGAEGPVVRRMGLEPSDVSLSIQVSSNATARLVVSGVSGEAYQMTATEDFQNWTNWPAQSADRDGLSVWTIPLSLRHLFFRAALDSSETASPSPAEMRIGERLFLETRFAQFFFVQGEGDLNRPLATGDPVLDETLTLVDPVPGPFAGQSMSCRACHMVDEQKERGLGLRAYGDFAIRSPIPDRGDGATTTIRNSPALANASLARPGRFFLHWDGEFAEGPSLVRGTLTGRNFGWLPGERAQAIHHIARVIREDSGEHFRGPDFGGAYRVVFLGTDPELSPQFRLPEAARLDVMKASDDEIIERIGTLVDAYLKSIRFAMDRAGEYEGSPYDAFLKKNALPRRPDRGEDDLSYSRRLRSLLENLTAPTFVTPSDGTFQTHTQAFRFDSLELEGLKMFLAEPDPRIPLAQGRIGNCITCHPAPHFTDFDFHNTGATQWEYDSVHGEGAFVQITIPGLSERRATPGEFLPPTPVHPQASGRFLAIPTRATPGFADLGLWNIYANPDFPASQSDLQARLSARFGIDSTDDLLPKTIALFKTPGLRNLSHSAPYLHSGQASTIESVLFFYRFTSDLARTGSVLNVDEGIAGISLAINQSSALAAFLRSLNEDYE